MTFSLLNPYLLITDSLDEFFFKLLNRLKVYIRIYEEQFYRG